MPGEATRTTVVDVEDLILAALEVMGAVAALGAQIVVEVGCLVVEAHLRRSTLEQHFIQSIAQARAYALQV